MDDSAAGDTRAAAPRNGNDPLTLDAVAAIALWAGLGEALLAENPATEDGLGGMVASLSAWIIPDGPTPMPLRCSRTRSWAIATAIWEKEP